MTAPLGGLTARRFLGRYWQKRPLLVRRAFPGFTPPLTPDELAGLACAPGVESRLVLERGGARPWQVVPGPQSERRLRRLPPRHWTLLVQGVDRLVPAVAALLPPFRFLPDWRTEDVMVSLAPPGGSVGPHVDSYDVFLLQGHGRRRWDLDPEARPELRPGLDLKILARFRPRRSYVLEPGDMLYLPPGVGHHGVALDLGMTFSIGFRAPSAREVLAAALRLGRDDALYRDPPRRPARHPGEIGPADLRALRELARGALEGPAFAQAAGELLTEAREPLPGRRIDPASLSRRLRAGAVLVRAPGARLAYHREGARARLFAEGRSFDLPPELACAGPLLTDRWRLEPARLEPLLGQKAFVTLLASLVGAGAMQLASPPSPGRGASRGAARNRRARRTR